MTANQYDGLPGSSSLSWVRDKVGDVDNSAIILLDTEIQSEIAATSNLLIAAANCADKCVTRLGEYSELAAMFQRRGDALRAESSRSTSTILPPTTIGTISDSLRHQQHHRTYTHRNGYRW
jgi:hypothetical protein